MIQRRKPLVRRTPLKRTGLKRKTFRISIPVEYTETKARTLKTRSPIRRVSKKRANERRAYNLERFGYLVSNPLCEITMARYRIDAARIVPAWNRLWENDGKELDGVFIPRANQIHHRNKTNGAVRLLKKDYWMAASPEGHAWAENNKEEARAIGVLLPISANPAGLLPDGSRCLTTPELLALRASGGGAK